MVTSTLESQSSTLNGKAGGRRTTGMDGTGRGRTKHVRLIASAVGARAGPPGFSTVALFVVAMSGISWHVVTLEER